MKTAFSPARGLREHAQRAAFYQSLSPSFGQSGEIAVELRLDFCNRIE